MYECKRERYVNKEEEKTFLRPQNAVLAVG
jgi:hypothetical protein